MYETRSIRRSGRHLFGHIYNCRRDRPGRNVKRRSSTPGRREASASQDVLGGSGSIELIRAGEVPLAGHEGAVAGRAQRLGEGVGVRVETADALCVELERAYAEPGPHLIEAMIPSIVR